MIAQLAGRRSRLTSGHEVRRERAVAARLAERHHHGLAHPGVGGEGGLDLPQLDTEAAHLHLVVEPAQVLDASVGQVAPEVAGAIEPVSGRSSRRLKGFGTKRSAVSSGRPR